MEVNLQEQYSLIYLCVNTWKGTTFYNHLLHNLLQAECIQ